MSEGEPRMAFMNLYFWLLFCGGISIGYILLVLKMRIGQIFLMIIHLCLAYMRFSILELRDYNIGLLSEIVFLIIIAFFLISLKGVNNYIKSRKNWSVSKG